MAEETDHDGSEDTSEDDDDTESDDESIPSGRFWHFSQLVGNNVYVGGGNIPSYKSKRGRAHLARTIEQFNVEERTWRQLETTGDHHPGLTGVTCASFGKYLFAYGGNNSERLNGVLSQLDLETLTWSQLSPETVDGPMRKDASGMVHFGEDSLAVVCGYAESRDPTKYDGGSSDRGSRFIERTGSSADGGGWTNEMHIFNRKFNGDHSGTWTSPSFSGPRPPPCADFSLTSVDLYRAILYGGHRGIDENSNDLYMIDFDNKAIMKLQPRSGWEDNRWPKMRMGHHAACCLGFDTKNAQLIMSGGRLKHQLPPKDIWILNLETQTWKEVKLPDNEIQNQLGRWGHTFTAITHSEGLVEIIMFGGCPGLYEVSWEVYKRKDFNRLSLPVSFILGFLDREWALLDVVDCSSHWNSTSKFKTTKLMPVDLGNPVMLDVLYSMEQDKIPVLTELISNQKIRSTILSSENTETIYKWPTFTKPSLHEPTWKTLCLILELANMNDLAKMIKDYLKKMKGPDEIDVYQRFHSDIKGIKYAFAQLLVQVRRSITDCKELIAYVLGVGILSEEEEEQIQGASDTIDVIAILRKYWSFLDCEPLDGIIDHMCSDAERRALQEYRKQLASFCNRRVSSFHGGDQHAERKGTHVEFDLNDPAVRRVRNLKIVIANILECRASELILHDIGRDGNPVIAQERQDEFQYRAELYCVYQPRTSTCKFDFVVTPNTKGHSHAVRLEYENILSELCCDQIIEFETDHITLDIPIKGISLQEQWKIIPLTRPVVLKRDVDKYEEGKMIPKCSFSVIQVGKEKDFPSVQYQVQLIGAKSPHDILTFVIKPLMITSAKQPLDTLPKKRTASEPEDLPVAKRRRELVRQSHSPDLKMPIMIAESKDIRPSLKNLHQLTWTNADGKFEKFRLVSQIAYKWRYIGTILGISYEELEMLGQKYFMDPMECCAAVLIHWFNNPSDDYPITWDGLCELLEDCELCDVVSRFKDFLLNYNIHIPTKDLYASSKTEMEENAKRLGDEKNSPTMGLRGVDVCGETCIKLTNSTQFFEWERFGLKIHIEENSLPADIEQMTVNIKASISGHYESPEDYERVSAVFWFQCEPNIELKKQVTVEIQHCAMSEHMSELSFARAMCTQEKLPYTFKLLDGGQFSNQSSYGVLSLNRFSGIAAFIKKLASLFISVKRNYYASLFHLTKESHHEVHILVTWNTDAHLQVIREKYRNALPGPEQPILFESDKISLNIPMEEGIDNNGWKIVPLKPPVIKKQDVDDYKSGQGIPSCHLLARVVDHNTTEPLQHTIKLDGAKPPHNAFTIFIDPSTQNQNRSAPEQSSSNTYCLSDVDSSETLGEDDLLDVMGEVISKKASYYALGRGLRIPAGELDAVQAQHHSTNLDSALNKVLLLWLRQNDTTRRFGPPTWRMLVKAVENRAGLNDHALAEKIAQTHTAHS